MGPIDVGTRLVARPSSSGSGHARYAGWVGALAVALGVGAAAVSMPAVAFADVSGSPGSTGSADGGAASGASSVASHGGARSTDQAGPARSDQVAGSGAGVSDSTTGGGALLGGGSPASDAEDPPTADVLADNEDSPTADALPEDLAADPGTDSALSLNDSPTTRGGDADSDEVRGGAVVSQSAPLGASDAEDPRDPRAGHVLQGAVVADPDAVSPLNLKDSPTQPQQGGAVRVTGSGGQGATTPAVPVRRPSEAIVGLNSAVVRSFDALSLSLSRLPAGPFTDLLSGALVLLRRNLFDQVPTVSSVHEINSALQTVGILKAKDPEGDPVRIELVVPPELGVLELAADGSYLYTPGPDFAGSDSFTVKVTDANGGFNLLYPFSDHATFYTTEIAGAAPSTMLTLHLREAFLKDVTGTENGQPGAGTLHGSYVYLYQPTPADGAPQWTKLIDNGKITSTVQPPDAQHPEYYANVALKAKGQPPLAGGAIYLIVQSENPEPCQNGQKSNCHTDLTTVTDWQEAFVQQKVQDYNFGYTAFEYALLGQAGDQGDITYIPGFGPHIAAKVCYREGNCDARGLALNSEDFIAGLLNAGVSRDAVFTYPMSPTSTPYSPLDGKPSIVISPSNGSFGSQYYPETNWDDYLEKTIDVLPPDSMTFSGTTSGARDAAGIWHNGQYYSYSVRAVQDDKATNFYLFSPNENSQTKGYMLIRQEFVGQNLYAPGQGSAQATLYESVAVDHNGVITELGKPYDIPGRTPPGTTPAAPGEFNVSGNNQWGNALTQYFTGFTAGYWGAVADQANPVNQGGSANLAGTVDLNSNLNWDPAYAFDLNRVPGTAPDYQHNDQYSFFFYENANTYASAFSDNLAQKLNPGPQISLATGPGQNENVSQIDLYVFGWADPPSGEGGLPVADPFYQKPVSTNFLDRPAGRDYVIPAQPSSTLALQVQGFNLASKVADDAMVQLGIYKGTDVNQHAQFDYVSLPTESDDGPYQVFTIAGEPGAWTAHTAGPNPGFIQINGLPMPSSVTEDDVYWYQFVVADSMGGNQRVFDIYATSAGTTPGEVQLYNPAAGVGSANKPLAAIDNNAGVLVNTATQIIVNLQPDASLPAALLTNGYDPNTTNKPQGPQAPGTNPVITALAAPVVGHVDAGGVFHALAGQYGTGVTKDQGYQPIVDQATTSAHPENPIAYFDNPMPTANVTAGTPVAFGWTGTNSYVPPQTGVRYAPVNPTFMDGPPYTMTQAGQVGEYTNKILPGNTARVTIMNNSTEIGTVDGVADLDGQWQTGPIDLGPGTYTATMAELTPAGLPVVDYLNRPKPDSVAVTIIVT